MAAEDVETLHRWHLAVNAGDVEAAVAECAEDVEVAGPRGVGTGHELVRGWLTRSGLRLEPLEPPVERGGQYVVRERASWTTTETAPVETYCVFTVAASKVTSIARYDDPSQIPEGRQPTGTSSA